MTVQNEEKSLAMEICEELKATACKWRAAFFAIVAVEVLTLIVGFLMIK